MAQPKAPQSLPGGLYKHNLHHPDGRSLYLYGRSPEVLQVPAVREGRTLPSPQLRWHALRGEWIMVASHRQERTFMPPAEYCPLCPTLPGKLETEIPLPSFEIAVFENKFPSLAPAAGLPEVSGPSPTGAGRGVCEVIVYSDDHSASTSSLSLERMQALVRAWRDRTEALGSLEGIDYVLIFENRGEEVGVTLTHPHGQIYAYPFVPPYLERELSQVAAKGDILGDLLAFDLKDKQRLVYENTHCLVLVPFWARYPFETYLLPKQPRTSLLSLDEAEMDALAEALKIILAAYDKLFGKPMPYVMAIQQAPRLEMWQRYRMRVEFLPRQRTETKLKYLAGTEVAAGAFAVDALAEAYAQRLRDATREVP